MDFQLQLQLQKEVVADVLVDSVAVEQREQAATSINQLDSAAVATPAVDSVAVEQRLE